jgi:sugar lactone lactonase YvrE
MGDIQLAFKGLDILGEGPVWSEPEQALYWVDIQGQTLQRWHCATGDYRVWAMPAPIGSFALRARGGAVVALKTGLAYFDPGTEIFQPIIDPEPNRSDIRFNDGKCDQHGRFWVGTMHDVGESRPIGALYRLDPDGSLHKMRDQVIVSNGLGWSPDNRTMYYTDSPRRTIYAYDFDLDTGRIGGERVFARDTVGFPDGLTVDTEGYIWSVKWDGWKVVRYRPDGSVDQEIEMPVQRPTSCIFGGPGLQDLYVTTARIGISTAELERQPLAGSVLVIRTGTTGLPEPRFSG